MLSFLGTFLLGLQLGATSCSISCMPVMTPVLLSQGDTKQQSIDILIKYFSAKVVAYISIALIAFFSASIIKVFVMNNQLFMKIAGSFIFILGAVLLYKTLFQRTACASSCSVPSNFGYMGMGFFSSFSFCLPLTSLVALCASTDNFINATFYGLAFGIGVVIVPFFLLYFFIFKITSTFLNEFMQHKKIIEISAQLFLMLIGMAVIQGWMKL